MSLIDRIREHWDKNPCDYNHAETFRAREQWRWKRYPYAKEELKIASDRDKVILEIGIGVASDACLSLNEGKPKRYIMVDISPETCKIAGRHIREHYAGDNWDIFNYDAAKLPLPDNSVDRVRSVGVLHHIPHVEKVMSEISRVLKPGGDVIFMFYHRDSKRFMVDWQGSEEVMISRSDPGSPYSKVYTKQEVTDLLGRHGITVTRFAEYEEGFALYVNGSSLKTK